MTIKKVELNYDFIFSNPGETCLRGKGVIFANDDDFDYLYNFSYKYNPENNSIVCQYYSEELKPYDELIKELTIEDLKTEYLLFTK